MAPDSHATPTVPLENPALLRDLASQPFVLLDDRTGPAGGVRLFRNPSAIITCAAPEDVAAGLEEIARQVAAGRHAAGVLAYELNGGFEPRVRRRAAAGPLLQFGLFDAPLRLTAEAADRLFAELAPPEPIRCLAPRLDEAAYHARFRRLADYIRSGDVYQVNLAFPLDFQYGGDPLALFAALRARQPVAHGAVVSLGGPVILSVSPELHLEITDGVAATRPMKGTIARGADAEADRHNRSALAVDAKQRAENLMIVDLMRNDLSRISAPGSVRVRDAFRVETYPTFHAMTSTVSAVLTPGVGLGETLAALFPCGSITGAPKVRAMEIIRELEDAPRGVYTGSIGEIAPGGRVRLNVAIRTAVLGPDGAGRYGVGSGVVADSDPGAEYRECLLKGRVLEGLGEDYGLVETLAVLRTSETPRLARHLQRLAQSARDLGFPFDVDRARQRVTELVRSGAPDAGDLRIRLELRRDGALTVTHGPLVALSPGPLRMILHDAPVDRADPFLRRKTTRRGFWDAALKRAEDLGADEALCVNREGALTEATRFNLFVSLDGRLVTPPVSDGVLPGVLRSELLETGVAVARSLTLEDLDAAEAVFLGNSARGLLPCERVPS